MKLYNQELCNIGKLITFGSLNLSLTFKIKESDILSLNLDFKKINKLNDLSFLIKNEQLWERIELSSESELLNTLFYMNRIKKIKNIVAYLIYNKIECNEEQLKFQRLLDCILLANGIVMYSYEIFKCNINIYFNIIYRNFSKKIILYEKNVYYPIKDISYNDSIELQNKEEKVEEESTFDEEGKEDLGLFRKIPEEHINFNDFRFFYINLGDYIKGGEFYEVFKLKEFYNFLKHIKKVSKIKIIINFGENLKNIGKYLIKLMQVSDIHIFRNKDELAEILMKKKEFTDIRMQKSNQKIKDIIKAQKIDQIRKIKTNIIRNESKGFSIINKSLSKLYKDPIENKASGFNTSRASENKSMSLKNILLTKSINISVNFRNRAFLQTNDIFNYIRDLIYNNNNKKEQIFHSTQRDKLGIYLDSFKKIYIVDYKKLKLKPDIIEYDLNLYPKPNIHNISELLNIKNMLYSNYPFLSYIIYSCILSTILDDIPKGKENYYLIYLYIRISILKILSVIKNGMQIPKDKKFYVIELKKEELNKIILNEKAKKKENGFNMNYFNSEGKEKVEEKEMKENSHVPTDIYGTLYIQDFKNSDFLKSKSPINSYKSNNKLFTKFIKENNIRTRKVNLKKDFLTKRKNVGFSFRFNGLPGLSVYLSKEDRKKIGKNKLPPLKLLDKNKNNFLNSFRNTCKIKIKKDKGDENYKTKEEE